MTTHDPLTAPGAGEARDMEAIAVEETPTGMAAYEAVHDACGHNWRVHGQLGHPSQGCWGGSGKGKAACGCREGRPTWVLTDPPEPAEPAPDAIERTGDLYRFEVPTPAGRIVVIAPDDLLDTEAERAGRLIAEVLRLAVNERRSA